MPRQVIRLLTNASGNLLVGGRLLRGEKNPAPQKRCSLCNLQPQELYSQAMITSAHTWRSSGEIDLFFGKQVIHSSVHILRCGFPTGVSEDRRRWRWEALPAAPQHRTFGFSSREPEKEAGRGASSRNAGSCGSGCRPARALTQSSNQTVRWARSAFLSWFYHSRRIRAGRAG